MATISADSISKHFVDHVALRDVSLSIKEGQIYGLLGPNGAGKTTLLRIINQIIEADSGTIQWDGGPFKREHIHQIGYLPEERGLYRKMKVGHHVTYLAQLKGLDKKEARRRAMEWLDRFDLGDWWNRRVEELSKGMAQKVQFAGTILHDPKLIILDEPFSGFDPINMDLIRTEIKRLKGEGASIILSTHNMNSVEEICDEITLINKGETVLQGSVDDVRTQFRPNLYEVEFTGNIIGFTNALWAGFELLEREQVSDNRFKVIIRLLNDNDVNALLKTVMPDVKIEGIREILPSMEEIFIKAVKEEKEVVDE